MKQIIIPVHSFIDVITNSSTEIFVNVTNNTIQYAKDLINTILKESGSDKTADDLYEFSFKDDDYYNKDNIMKEYEYDEDEYNEEYNMVGETYLIKNLVITPKSGNDNIDLATTFERIFDVFEGER